MANGQRASMIANSCGVDYWQKRRGLSLNMFSKSSRPGVNKKTKRFTHKIERKYDKKFCVEELNNN
jgi:hypothetical protein